MCVAAGKKCFTVFYFITVMKWGDIEQTDSHTFSTETHCLVSMI